MTKRSHLNVVYSDISDDVVRFVKSSAFFAFEGSFSLSPFDRSGL